MQPPFPFYSLPWGARFCLKKQSTRLQLSKVVPSTYKTLGFDLSKSFGEPASSDITPYTRYSIKGLSLRALNVGEFEN
jgi:hypothetical protein